MAILAVLVSAPALLLGGEWAGWACTYSSSGALQRVPESYLSKSSLEWGGARGRLRGAVLGGAGGAVRAVGAQPAHGARAAGRWLRLREHDVRNFARRAHGCAGGRGRRGAARARRAGGRRRLGGARDRLRRPRHGAARGALRPCRIGAAHARLARLRPGEAETRRAGRRAAGAAVRRRAEPRRAGGVGRPLRPRRARGSRARWASTTLARRNSRAPAARRSSCPAASRSSWSSAATRARRPRGALHAHRWAEGGGAPHVLGGG